MEVVAKRYSQPQSTILSHFETIKLKFGNNMEVVAKGYSLPQSTILSHFEIIQVQ